MLNQQRSRKPKEMSKQQEKPAKKSKKTQGVRPPAEANYQIADIPLTDIVLNTDYQMRVESRSPAEYLELIVAKEGDWPFPPIKCCEVRGKLLCVDGFTRCQAALDYVAQDPLKQAAEYTIPVSYKKATAKEAFIEALASNADHGYRRTNADKRNAVLKAVGAMPSATTRKIADACRVSHTYVANIRAQIVNDGKEPTAEDVIQAAAEHDSNAVAEAAHEEQLTAAEKKQKELGACPVCKQTGKWIERDDGWHCGDCLHPHGEPAGDVQEPAPTPAPAPPAQPPVTVTETTPAGFDVPEQPEADTTAAPAVPTGNMVDMRADKIKKAKAALGVIVRVADELAYYDLLKDAIETIQAKLAEG